MPSPRHRLPSHRSCPRRRFQGRLRPTATTSCEVKDLHVNFYTSLGVVRALNGVSFNIPRGKVLGVVGESGCGKSITGLSIMQLVPRPGRIEKGEVLFHETGDKPVNVLTYERNSDEMRKIRGNEIGMIFQEPMTSLNPLFTVGAPDRRSDPAAPDAEPERGAPRAVDILTKVGMPNPERIAEQLSAPAFAAACASAR